MRKYITYIFGIIALVLFANQIAFGATYTERDIDVILQRHQSTPPTTPASGKVRVYSKSDNKLYILDSTATETEVGGAAGTEDNTANTLMKRSANSTTKISAVDFEKYSATPTSPDTGFIRVYCKTNSTCYSLDENGSETELGGGSGSTLLRIFNARFSDVDSATTACNDATCTIRQQHDDEGNTDTIASITSESTGNYDVNITASRCSQPPVCSVTSQGATVGLVTHIRSVPTTTLIEIGFANDAGGDTNAVGYLNCTCLK